MASPVPCLIALLVGIVLSQGQARACTDLNLDNPDPYPLSPPDPIDGGTWASNLDGTYTFLPDSGTPSSGGGATQPPPPPPPAPPGPPSIGWDALPGGAQAGATYQVDAVATDPAGLLAAVSIDFSQDGGASWTPFAYAGGGDGTTGTSGNPITFAEGATYQFRAWSADSIGQGSEVIYSGLYAVPLPPPAYPVEVAVSGPGTVSTPGGLFTAGTPFSVLAVPSARAVFSGWSGDVSGGQNPASLTVSGPTSLTANFSPAQASLTLVTSGSGSASGGGTYPVGTQVAISAVPSPQWAFSGWSPPDGVASPSAASTTVLVNSPMSLTASFSLATAVLQTTAIGGGSVTGSGTYPINAVATVNAQPGPGYGFSQWEGDLSGSQNPGSVLMSASKSVTAVFVALLAQTIAVSVPPAQTTTSPPVSIIASASSGLPVILSLTSGPGSLSGNTVTLSGVPGLVSLVASQPGNAAYAAAPSVPFSFSVSSPSRHTAVSAPARTKKNDPSTPSHDLLIDSHAH